jgi:hypothetical protein
VTAALVGLIVTPVAIVVDDRIIAPNQWLSGLPPEIGNGLIPTLIIAAAVAGFALWMTKRFGASKNEAVQALFVLLVTAVVVLTLVGALLRGPGMRLMGLG